MDNNKLVIILIPILLGMLLFLGIYVIGESNILNKCECEACNSSSIIDIEEHIPVSINLIPTP